jgi:hypothetical protein
LKFTIELLGIDTSSDLQQNRLLESEPAAPADAPQ